MLFLQAKIDTIIHIPRLLRAVLKSPELSPTEVISSVDLSFGVDSFTENTVVVKVKTSVPLRLVGPIIA